MKYTESLPLLENQLEHALWEEYQFELEYMSESKLSDLKANYKSLPKRQVTRIAKTFACIFEEIDELGIYGAMAEYVETDIENGDWDVNNHHPDDLIRTEEDQRVHDLAMSLPDSTLIVWRASTSIDANSDHQLQYNKSMTLGEAKQLGFQQDYQDRYGKKCKCGFDIVEPVKKGFFARLLGR
ncbi:hypothetical protein [Vibrio neonatus]|uniref:hypothetical protein n=1 Tax=Vibrio neonatus TaxID=278860 RepID=UPI0021C4255C|nr:hypothetical protein [Vibrio neonatus]